MFTKVFKIGILGVFLVFILTGCTFPWEKNKKPIENPIVNDQSVVDNNIETKTNDVKKFKDEAELKSFLQNNSSNLGMVAGDLLFETSSAASSMEGGFTKSMSASLSDSVQSSAPGVADYSTSNNQVFGVDEADIIKTDGQYIYAIVGNKLKIINSAQPADAKVVSEITFKSTPLDLFVSAGRLVVFGNDYGVSETVMQSFRYGNNFVFFKVFDVSNPSDPKETRSLDFEGNYTAARMIGNYVYFITNKYAYYIEGEPLTPRIFNGAKMISGGCAADSASCFVPEVYYFDSTYNNYNFTSVNTININDATEKVGGQVYLVNSGQNVYVSANNIYLSGTEYLSEYDLEQEVKRNIVFNKLESGEQEKIKQIEASPAFILSKDEKKMKVSVIIQKYLSSLSNEDEKNLTSELDSLLLAKIKEKAKEMEKTVIHKIAIKAGKAEYLTKGEIQGSMLNQFSMDEHDNYLRVATTRNEMWSRLFKESQKSYSNVYILDENLRISGSLENLATDEKIYSARFIGDRAYVVTFKKTDPLYVIDLSDKTKPAVLGALKIPGFSSYLHPVDDKGIKLLGFGRDAEESADGSVKVKGLKLSLFDFSDVNKPKELRSYVIGDEFSSSVALDNHLAFLYSADKNIISIPAVLSENNKLSFSGALIFSIEDNSLSLKGKINHLLENSVATADYWQRYYYNDNVVNRSFYINNNLFTFSNKFLKINNINDLSEVGSLILTSGSDDYIITPKPQPAILPISPVLETTPPELLDSTPNGSAAIDSGAEVSSPLLPPGLVGTPVMPSGSPTEATTTTP